jgi:hypothetical protein
MSGRYQEELVCKISSLKELESKVKRLGGCKQVENLCLMNAFKG